MRELDVKKLESLTLQPPEIWIQMYSIYNDNKLRLFSMAGLNRRKIIFLYLIKITYSRANDLLNLEEFN